jgi:hypothetical protein
MCLKKQYAYGIIIVVYLMTLSLARLCRIEWLDGIRNGKDLEGSGHGLLVLPLWLLPRGMAEYDEKCVMQPPLLFCFSMRSVLSYQMRVGDCYFVMQIRTKKWNHFHY